MKNTTDKFLSIQKLGPVFQALILEKSKVKITVTGNSMYPLLRTGIDEVILKQAKSYKKGDVVFYKRDDGSYILHRIVGKENDAFYLAGDAEIRKEYPIYANQIIGVATDFVSRGKRFSHKNPVYLIYSFLWMLLLPYRQEIIRMYINFRSVLKCWRKLW